MLNDYHVIHNAAVHQVMARCGQDPQEVKAILLARETRLTRAGLLALWQLSSRPHRGQSVIYWTDRPNCP